MAKEELAPTQIDFELEELVQHALAFTPPRRAT